MASLYKKRNPGNDRVYWMCRIKVSGKQIPVSIQMEVADNKREAQRRADALEREAMTGSIGKEALEWMGHKPYANLQLKIGKLSASATRDTSIETWAGARAAYIRSREARDTKHVPAGKAKSESRTKSTVYYVTKLFCEWAEKRTNGVFLKTTWTSLMIEYIEHRKSQGVASATLWNKDYSFNRLWGEYLASRGLCEMPNRQMIRETMPEKWSERILPPAPELDLACLKVFYERRNDHLMKPGRKHLIAQGKPCGKEFRARHVVWSLVLIVRGLGCRPSEATSLDWETVDLDRNIVRFIKSKNAKNRSVPILYQWVLDGLRELWDDQGKPKSGALVKTVHGKIYTRDSDTSALVRSYSRQLSLPYEYKLKRAQKSWHEQTIRIGFRPWDVAKWADHSVRVQEAHYASAETYLPRSGGPFDYGQFGVLSEYGKLCMEHFGIKLPEKSSSSTE
jgi:integrase